MYDTTPNAVPIISRIISAKTDATRSRYFRLLCTLLTGCRHFATHAVTASAFEILRLYARLYLFVPSTFIFFAVMEYSNTDENFNVSTFKIPVVLISCTWYFRNTCQLTSDFLIFSRAEQLSFLLLLCPL